MIKVGKRWDPNAVYIGRPSPLGNQFAMQSEDDRDDVCDRYEAWFNAKIAEEDPAVIAELGRLCDLAAQGNLVLGCFCAPKRCHGDTIKRFLDLVIGEE